jgi:hypothetical protein
VRAAEAQLLFAANYAMDLCSSDALRQNRTPLCEHREVATEVATHDALLATPYVQRDHSPDHK